MLLRPSLPPALPPQGPLKPLSGQLHLPLAADARLIVSSTPADVGKDARLFALFLKAPEGLFKGLAFLDANTRHLAFTNFCLQE